MFGGEEKLEIAFVLIRTEPREENDVLKELKRSKEVKEAYIVYGIYDISAKVVVEDMDRLEAFTTRIKRIEGINSILTLLVTKD
jgi:DNA-binding Lrp family transcriptional regulator